MALLRPRPPAAAPEHASEGLVDPLDVRRSRWLLNQLPQCLWSNTVRLVQAGRGVWAAPVADTGCGPQCAPVRGRAW